MNAGRRGLWVDGSLLPSFQKGTLFYSLKLASWHNEFRRKATHFVESLTNFQPSLPIYKENTKEKKPCLENFLPKKPPIRAAHGSTVSTCYVTPPPEGWLDSSRINFALLDAADHNVVLSLCVCLDLIECIQRCQINSSGKQISLSFPKTANMYAKFSLAPRLNK